MNTLPSEKRKAYFLQPKTALTLESLYDMVLEADGISKEVLESQRAKLKLVSTLFSAVDDEKRLNELIEEHREQLDYAFFLLLSDMIDAQEEQSDDEGAASLTQLREKLLERVNPMMPGVADENATYDDLIEMLQGKEGQEAWRATIALNRARLDYGFFQHLTGKIDAATGAGDADTANNLTDLRKRILDEIDAQNKMVREAEDQASLLIMQISEAEDLEAAVREHQDEMGQVFLSVLVRYQATAKAHGDDARADKLGKILEMALAVFEERLPPDLRLVNRLLRADYPEETSAVLEEHRGLLDDDLLKSYDQYVSNLERDQQDELAEKLKQVREQIVAKMTVLRG